MKEKKSIEDRLKVEGKVIIVIGIILVLSRQASFSQDQLVRTVTGITMYCCGIAAVTGLYNVHKIEKDKKKKP